MCIRDSSKPLCFEEVAIEYPELRIGLAHFGWPWVQDTAMMLLKYPNVYAEDVYKRQAHPSPFSAQSGFLGCRHFSKTNAFLSQFGRSVDWQLPQ